VRRGCRAHICLSNSNCAESQSCVQSPDGVRECRDSCEHEQPICGRNALCRTHAHRAICDCRPGFVGDPLDLMVGCQPTPTSATTFNACSRDSDCLAEAACSVQANGVRNCSLVCDRWRCALNARCIARDHIPSCECSPGYIGEKPLTEACQLAVYDLCKTDNDCEDDRHCRPIGTNGRLDCVPVCDFPPKDCLNLGRHCIGRSHRAHCECAPTHVLLQNRCEPHLCDRDSHCGHGRVCRLTNNGKRDCVDPCLDITCGSSAICRLGNNNRPSCQCRQGYTGDAADERRGCVPLDDCVLDVHCAENLACRLAADGIKRCVDPCSVADQPCGPSAVCKVADHVPQCECLANYFGRPDRPQVGCRPISNECETDAECPSGSKCQLQTSGGRLCVHLCDKHVCGKNALCVSGPGKQPTCICRTGYSGNPLVSCEAYQCSVDTDCAQDSVCALDVNGNRRCAPVCALVTCAKDAGCIAAKHLAQCMCPVGFEGNPYTFSNQTIKSIDSLSSSTSEPKNSQMFDAEHVVQTLKANLRPVSGCKPVASHKCTDDSSCPLDSKCAQLKSDQFDCIPVCKNLRCGTNAHCVNSGYHTGACECLEGHVGDPTVECKAVQHECSISEDCPTDFQICKPDSDQGRRICANVCADESACQAHQICIPGNFTYRCDCEQGYEMDRLTGACRRPDHECESDVQCSEQSSCRNDASGARRCLQSCDFYACPANARCRTLSHKARCECEPGFTGDPQSRDGCSRIPTHQCETNDDCAFDQRCTSEAVSNLNAFNAIGTYFALNTASRRCVSACFNIQCGPLAVCIVNSNRQPVCKCPGQLYIGDPYDLSTGCKRVECTSDSDCANNRACSEKHFCFDPCISSCTSNTVCVVQSHRAHCSCAPGFVGDAYMNGCKRHVSCEKCHSSALCIPNNANAAFTDNVADGLSSSTSLTSRNRDYMFNANSENNREPVESYHDLKFGAGFGELCVCPPEHVGNAYNKSGLGCLPAVACPRGDLQCPLEAACVHDASGLARCTDPCPRTHCGPNSRCVVRNHLAHCECAPTFVSVKLGSECIRQVRTCKLDNDCGQSSACVAGQCRIVCSRDTDCAHGERCADHLCVRPCLTHEACELLEACVSPGFCQIGCRTSDNCTNDQVCIRNHCVDPCKLTAVEAIAWDKAVSRFRFNSTRDEKLIASEEISAIDERKVNITTASNSGVCGPNSQCLVQAHRLTCTCLNGFEPDPTPYIGCRRQLRVCSIEAGVDCPSGLVCRTGRCRPRCTKHMECAQGESCVNGWCMAGCFNDGSCATGELCVGQLCVPGCRSDSDCSLDQRCDSTRKCVCRSGFKASHDGKCADIDECHAVGKSQCGKNAECHNLPGSFKCVCVDGRQVDPTTNCESLGQCPNGDSDCPDDAICINDTNYSTFCVNPCNDSFKKNVTSELKTVEKRCGPNADCQVIRHRLKCSCPTISLNGAHFTGDAYDLTTGCHTVDCVKDEHCASDRQCINFVCEEACDSVDCGPHGSCIIVRDREPACRCESGFENNGRLTCSDIDECRTQRPCHESALCVNLLGSFSCKCPVGLIGDPYGAPGCLQPDSCPNGDRDCPDAASCVQVHGQPRCRDRCHDPTACGRNATCVTINHRHQCSCPPGSTGNPMVRCETLQCERSLDCANDSDVCVGNKCVSVCLTHTSCGLNAECVPQIHSYTCRCKDGYYGDPVIGCRRRLKCDSANDCPLGQSCGADKHCTISCRTSRDCLPSERCNSGLCAFVCQSMNDCAPGQLCSSGHCQDLSTPVEGRCSSDSDCNSEFACRATDPDSHSFVSLDKSNDRDVTENNTGSCLNVCEGILCARNSDCKVKDHKPICECRNGYFGNPNDERIGCRRAECEQNFDCSFDKVCQNHQCISACQAFGASLKCASNAACVPIDHRADCRCSAGYTGDPYRSCRQIDFCKQLNSCHSTAICKSTLQGPICECPIDKSIGSPYEEPGCRSPNTCPNGNSDCPANAVCAGGMCRNPCEKTLCGPNAFCRVENRTPVCSCRSGFIGLAHDRQRGCTRTLQQCTSSHLELDSNGTYLSDDKSVPVGSSQCQVGQACVQGICRQVCSTHGQCGENERCTKKVCNQRCDSDQSCAQFAGHICNQGVCTIGCRSDLSCSSHESCLLNRCVPLCFGSSSCAANAVCQAVAHSKKCSCMSGFEGMDPVNGICRRTQRLCISNVDCAGINQSCSDGRCIQNCVSDSECAFGEKCEQNQCIQLCGSSLELKLNSTSFGSHVEDGTCPPGNICSLGRCSLGCRNNNMCAPHLACVRQRCQDPCAETGACGANSRCLVLEHRAHCVCPPGFVGRPTANVACVRLVHRCESDTDCAIQVTPFSAIETYGSSISGHLPDSTKHFVAGSNVSSLCVDGRCLNTCAASTDCAVNERCDLGKCVGACARDRDCASGEICQHQRCQIGCRSDEQCALTDRCDQNRCVHVCTDRNACGTNALCRAVQHQKQCQCTVGTSGNADVECIRQSRLCSADSQCSRTERCNGSVCKQRCAFSTDCLDNERCESNLCELVCKHDRHCPSGFLCVSGFCVNGCSLDTDCSSSERCVAGQCRSACSGTSCGLNAVCIPIKHQSVCRCPSGFSGSPKVECRPIQCVSDSQCDSGHICQQMRCVTGCRSNEACAHLQNHLCTRSSCVPGCSFGNVCGRNALCSFSDNRPYCRCPTGWIGNPHVECALLDASRTLPASNRTEDVEPTRTLGCRSDSNCDSGFECIHERVKNVTVAFYGSSSKPSTYIAQQFKECIF
jgi:hypothetical protein